MQHENKIACKWLDLQAKISSMIFNYFFLDLVAAFPFTFSL
jgi:hypothetical protein